MEEIPDFSFHLDDLFDDESPSTASETGKERFPNLSEHDLEQILEERHSKATKKSTNWIVGTFKGKKHTGVCFSQRIKQ